MPALALLRGGGSEGHNESKAKHESAVGGRLHGEIYEPNYSLQDKWSDFCFQGLRVLGMDALFSSELPEGCGPVGQSSMESNANCQRSGKHDL